MSPPHTSRDAVVDTLHGVAVPDPYRWLEAGDDPAVQRWVTEQNERTRSLLDARPDRNEWHQRLLAAMALPVVLQAELRGDVVVVLERPHGADQARLVVRSSSDPDAEPVVLADPSAGTADGASAVDWFWTSGDGSLVAYGTSEGGTEHSTLWVARTSDGSHLADQIPDTRACSVAWEPDGSGFFYTRYPEGDEYNRTVHHHTLGCDWREDPVVWAEHETPQSWPSVDLSPGGRFVLVTAMVGWSRSDVHLLDRTTGEWQDVVAGVESATNLTFTDDSTLIGVTTLDASNGRIVSVDLSEVTASPSSIAPSEWTTLVPERDVVLGVPQPVPGGFLVVVTEAAVDRIERWADGASEPLVVTGTGLVSVGGLAADRTTGDALALITGFESPPALWRIAPSETPSVVRWGADSGNLGVELSVSKLEYPSLDGTMIGLFVVHRADVTPSPDTPTILTGYGGFAIARTPEWSATIASWCATGGSYAIAGLRGGYERGEDWHQAGRREHKQNVFDDFHCAADWLVDHGMTSRDRLAIAGGSNGGLLVGAALTQRPDLCRAVWCAVPLLDMIRFPQFLIARLWTDEYGDPNVVDEFEWLMAYSPYHRVLEGQRYPAVLLTTAEGDSRVDPLHARKMAAMLQCAAIDQDGRPILLYQEGRAGHGVGKPVGKRAAEQADVLAFLSWQLGWQPGGS